MRSRSPLARAQRSSRRSADRRHTDELDEHEVLSFARQQDGGTTTITFTLDGDEATAWFPTPYSPELSPTLTIDGATVELAAIDPAELGDAVYGCR